MIAKIWSWIFGDNPKEVIEPQKHPIVYIDCPKCGRCIYAGHIEYTTTYAQCNPCHWRFAWDTSDGTFNPAKRIGG